MDILNLLNAVRDKVAHISIFEELFNEIEKTEENSNPKDILLKLRLIVISKIIPDAAKMELLSFIQSLESFSLKELQLMAMTSQIEIVESGKMELEPIIEELLKRMSASGDGRWKVYLDIAKCFDDLGLSRFEYLRVINEILNYDITLNKNGIAANMDVNTIYEFMKKNKDNGEQPPSGEDFPGTSGRGR